MPRWQVPTLLTEQPDAAPQACPTCGCPNVPPYMLFDLRPLPPALRAALALRRADTPFACDGCMATVFREGRASHREVWAAQGADAEALAVAEEYMRHLPFPPGSRAHADKVARGLDRPRPTATP